MSLLIRNLKHGQAYFYEFVVHGIRYTKTIGRVGIIPRSLALQIERKARVDVERGLLSPVVKSRATTPTLDALMSIYVQDRRPHWRPGTLIKQQATWRTLLPLVGSMRVDQVTRDTLLQVRDDLLPRLSASTLNKNMQLLKTLLVYAIDLGHLTSLPYGRLRQVPQTRTTVHVLEPQEEARMLELCPVPRLAVVIMLALYAGLRRGECLGLEWRDVDFCRRTLSIRPEVSKTHRARILPLCATAIRALGDLPRPHHTVGIPPSSVFGYRTFDTQFRRLARKAGLRGFTFHHLRHTFASRLQASGVDIRTVSAFLGHASIDTTWIYTHIVPGHAREAITVLDASQNAVHENPVRS